MDTSNGIPSGDPIDHKDRGSSSRRLFIVAGTLFLAGCATKSNTVVSRLPDPWWSTSTTPLPRPPARPPLNPVPSGVLSRAAWAKGSPVPSRMDMARRITRITIHHDGMQPFLDSSYEAAAGRLEAIRRAHLRRRPQRFGDIGYHYAIDPAGRVWSCRPLDYQGAHVAGQNQGNLGIVVLGNYDRQALNRAQQAAVQSFLASQAKGYGIPAARIQTHMEMAATACPGESLQRFMVDARRSRSLS